MTAPVPIRKPASHFQKVYFLWLALQNASAIIDADLNTGQMSELISEQYGIRSRFKLQFDDISEDASLRERVMRLELPEKIRKLKKKVKAL